MPAKEPSQASLPWLNRPESHLVTSVLAFGAGVLLTWLVIGGAVPKTQTPPQVEAAHQAHQPAIGSAALGGSPAPAPVLTAERAVTLGNTYYDQRRWMDAITQYEYALANGIDNPNVRTDLGNCFRFVGLPERALAQYEIAQRQEPRHEQSLFNTATLYTEVLHDLPKAVEIWRQYLQRFPGSDNMPRVQRFLSQNPHLAAALQQAEAQQQPAAAHPAQSQEGVSEEAGLPEQKKSEVLQWMEQGEPALPTQP